MTVPKYLSIKNDLKEEILSDKFEYGDLFYSESELEKKFNVSSITVIRAIKELVKDGYLVRFQGKGTFISRSRKKRPVRMSDIEVFSQSYDHDDVKVLSLKQDNQPDILEKLELNETDFYFEIIRVRCVADITYMIQYSYIPAKYIKNPTDKDYYSSIYTRFREDYGLHLHDEHFIETDELMTPPNEYVQTTLNVGDREPVVKQTRKTYLQEQNDEVVEYIFSFKKWDFFKIEYETIEF